MVRKRSSIADCRLLKLIDPDGLGEREAKVVIERTAYDVDQVKRSSFHNVLVLDTRSQASSQGANYDRTFVDGSLHRIRPPTITLRAALVTKGQQSGSFKEVSLKDGNPLVPCCGFMASVRSCYHSNSILANDHFF